MNTSTNKMFKVHLRHPFTMFVYGPTGSGKTNWVSQLIDKKNIVCDLPPVKITYCYGSWQSQFSNLVEKGVNFIEGLPEDALTNLGGDKPEWLIIDDLMSEALNNKSVSDIFTKGSHHKNICVILIVQDFFKRGNETRTISLNSNYLVLFKNPRSKLVASLIAREMYPGKSKLFSRIYESATKEPFSYLFIDLKNDTPDELRLLSNVLGENKYISVFKI